MRSMPASAAADWEGGGGQVRTTRRQARQPNIRVALLPPAVAALVLGRDRTRVTRIALAFDLASSFAGGPGKSDLQLAPRGRGRGGRIPSSSVSGLRFATRPPRIVVRRIRAELGRLGGTRRGGRLDGRDGSGGPGAW